MTLPELTAEIERVTQELAQVDERALQLEHRLADLQQERHRLASEPESCTQVTQGTQETVG